MGRNVLSDVLLIVCLCLFCLAIMIGCGGGGGGGSSSGDTSSSSSSSGSSSGSSSSSSSSGSSSGSSSSSSSSGSSSSSSSSSGGGTLTFSWEWRKTGLNNPIGITATSTSIYSTQYTTSQKIATFDLSGNRLSDINNPSSYPILGIAVDTSGNRYVVDNVDGLFKNNSLLVNTTYRGFDVAAEFGNYVVVLESGNGINGFVEVFNTSGTRIYGPWEISGANTANGIALTPDGNSVIIADTDNYRILKYSISGTCEGTFGSYGTGSGEYEFAVPRAADVDSDGNIYVVDGGNNRFSVYGSNFSFRGRYQGTQGTGDGQFRSPYGIAVTLDGSAVYVSNSIGNNLQKYIKNP